MWLWFALGGTTAEVKRAVRGAFIAEVLRAVRGSVGSVSTAEVLRAVRGLNESGQGERYSCCQSYSTDVV